MADFGSGDGGKKSLKTNFKGWREIFVLISKLLKWEKPYYFGIVIGIVSFIFLCIWYIDPSIITGLSMVVLILCISDFVIPFLAPILFHEANWNSEKEKEYSHACKALADLQAAVYQGFKNLSHLKDANPLLYIAVATVSLSTLAWLGNQMHNLMLLYFAVLIFASLPGLAHHGILQRGAGALGKLNKKRKD